MSTQTTNIALNKDDPKEFYNVERVNQNLDKIDAALKAISDKADQAFTQANNGKTDIADVVGSPVTSADTFSEIKSKIQTIKNTMANNLTAKGITAATSETLDSLTRKIASIVKGSGNAQPSDVLAPKTFSNSSGVEQTGTMVDNGPNVAETLSLTTQGAEYTISKGYHTGLRKIKAAISGLASGVIKAGVNVGGVTGTFTADGTATANDIRVGKDAYVNGAKVSGGKTSYVAGSRPTALDLWTGGGSTIYQKVPQGVYDDDVFVSTNVPTLLPSNIRLNTVVCGITGTLEEYSYTYSSNPTQKILEAIGLVETNSTTYTTLRQFTCKYSGKLRISYQVTCQTTGQMAYSNIFLNGVAQGAEVSVRGYEGYENWVTSTKDINVIKNDVITIQGHSDNGYYCKIHNLYVYAGNSIIQLDI